MPDSLPERRWRLRERLRLRRHVWRLRHSGLFDEDWYRAHTPGLAETGLDPIEHYLLHGGHEGRDPSPQFDSAAYLAANRDVAAAGVNPLVHYVLSGWAQQRSLHPDGHRSVVPRTGPPSTGPVVAAVEHLASALVTSLRLIRRATRQVADEPRRVLSPRRLWARLAPLARAMGTGEPAATNAPAHRPEDTPYGQWVALYDTPSASARRAMAARGARLDGPRFSILVPVHNPPVDALQAMLASVQAQFYPRWELCLADDASTDPRVAEVLRAAASVDPRIRVAWRAVNGGISAASNDALRRATGDWVALLDHDDVLAPHALLVMADAIAANPGADLLYSDEDKLGADGVRTDPYFKPAYSPELLEGQNFISHLGVYRARILRELGGFRSEFDGSQDYDLALRVAARTTGPIVHVPHILYHWRLFPGAGTFSSTQADRATLAARRAIAEAAASRGEEVEVVPGPGGYHRVLRKPPRSWPSVTAIVPTRDHAEVLQVCIDGLLQATDYPCLEVIVADNGSTEEATHAALAAMASAGVAVLPCPGPFNYSAINNAAAATARGEMLLFLNNDVSMLDPGWLREMVLAACGRDVGAVGAKLLYPDDTLQHGGVVLGLGGVAGHVHLGVPRNDPGYFGRLMLTQEVGAVTAACMLVPARHFAAVGGFDAEHLRVAFNDVDLCLRLRAAGLRILWTPHAVLRHWESKSRGSDFAPARLRQFEAEIAYMRDRWNAELDADPFFNENLSLALGEVAPGFPPRVARPWDIG